MTCTPNKLKGNSEDVVGYMKQNGVDSLDDYYGGRLFDQQGNALDDLKFDMALNGFREVDIAFLSKLPEGARVLDVNGRKFAFMPSIFRKDRVLGYDVTFSIDKSFSAAWALADPKLRAELKEIFRQAVAEGTKALDIQNQQGEKTIAEVFNTMHFTSREGDPQLHVHTVLTNNGENGAIDSKALYSSCSYANAVMNAYVMRQMAERGWDMTFDGRGAVVDGFEDVIGDFSKRRKQIEVSADELGIDLRNRDAGNAVARATRKAKGEGLSPELCERMWAEVGAKADLRSEEVWRAGTGKITMPEGHRLEAYLGRLEDVTHTKKPLPSCSWTARWQRLKRLMQLSRK